MILDTFDNASLYFSAGKHFEKAFHWLSSTDLSALPEGKIDIDGERIYATVKNHVNKPVSEGRFEAHRRYADIQVLIAGEEIIGWSPLSALVIDVPYDEKHDLIFLKGTLSDGSALHMKPGMFAVFYPADAHMPLLVKNQPATLRKVVVKVQVA